MKKVALVLGLIALIILIFYLARSNNTSALLEEYQEFSSATYKLEAQLLSSLNFSNIGGHVFEDVFGSARAGYNGTTYQLLVSLEGLPTLNVGDTYEVYLVKRAIRNEQEENVVHLGPLEVITRDFVENDSNSGFVKLYRSDVDLTEHTTLIVVYESPTNPDSGSVIVQGQFGLSRQ